MKKKTTWAASVVKKQLQTCCKHQTFSLETGDDCNTSQGSQRVINISSPIREFHHQEDTSTSTTTTPVLQRRKSFNVLHGRSLLTGTPEPLTPFRKSVESAIPLCRSSSATTFINKSSAGSSSQQRLKEESEQQQQQQPVAVVKVVPCPPPPRKVVLHKSGPLPVLQQLLRNGGVVSSPLHVKKQLSGPLPGGRPPLSCAPSPLPPRISKVKFSPTTTNILLVKDRSPECGFQPSPEFAQIETVADLRDEEEEVEVRDRTEEKVQAHAAAVKIQAAYRGHRARAALRGSSCSDDDDDGEVSVPSISTQMSRTDPQKQRKTTSPAPPQQQQRGVVLSKGWNGSIRSAQDHQALLRSRQEAAMKRERAMEYALSRQRWRGGAGTLKPAASKPGWMITDDRVPDKPGWVRNWLERATRMSNANHDSLGNKVNFVDEIINPPPPPESESLSMKSTVGMCTTDIGSLPPLAADQANNNNLGWPLSLRQQHAAGLLHHHHAGAATPSPPPPPAAPHDQFPCEFSTSTSGESSAPGESRTPRVHYHRRSSYDDRESVGSCDGPPVNLIKVPSPAASKPRGIQKNSAGNSNSLKEKLPREKMPVEHPQSQVSVALSDGNSDDTTAASIQRPLWR